MMKLYAAPLQGLTEAPWRDAHHEIFGGVDTYYTPFIRIERGEFRNKDLREIAPDNNHVPHLVPQLIASKPAELEVLVGLLAEKGYHEVDINMGCPFPLLTAKHKGAGLLPYPSEVEALLQELSHYPEMKFSVKMRLGLGYSDEWKGILPLLNKVPLQRIVLHARTGKQQYSGEINFGQFSSFYAACAHPLVYNGSLTTVEDIARMEHDYPQLEGVMLGRGLLARPSLATEYRDGVSLSDEALRVKVKELHDRLYHHFESNLQGDVQLLSKIKPYWEYLLPELEKKYRKAILKSNRLDKYIAAVGQAFSF